MIEMCKEMKKLRNLLDSMGVEWTDESIITPQQLIDDMVSKGLPESFVDTTMYRTHFMVNGHRASAINGFGSYGGYDPMRKNNQGLLELMPNLDNMSEPIGHLTAEEVIDICFKKEKP